MEDLAAAAVAPVRLVVVARRAPSAMRVATRCAAIFTGEILDQEAFQYEIEDALFLAGCRFLSSKHRNFLLAVIAGAIAENMNSLLCPRVITLPFRNVYRGEIQHHSDSTCYSSFRFTKQQLRRLLGAIRLNRKIVLPNRATYSGETCMLVGLFYMHRPVTQEQTADFLGITCQPNVSRLFSFFLDHVVSNFQHLIALDSEDSLQMWAPYVEMFKRKLQMFHVAGVDSQRYNNVIGFVDGKLHRVGRPKQQPQHSAIGVDTQKTVFNGHKHIHGIKFQAMVAPNGIILELSGGYRGRVHDSTMMRRSGLNEMMQALSHSANQPCHVYGDAAYPMLSHIRKAYGTRRVSIHHSRDALCSTSSQFNIRNVKC
jgi:hypothetical protein